MRSSRWTPIAGWLAATATSIVLASVALTPVLRAGSPEDTALSSIDQLPAAQTSFPVPLPVVTNPSTTDPTTAPTPRHTRASPATTKPKPPATTTAPPATTEDGWTVTTGDDGVRTYVRSFRVAGGQAVVKVTSDAVVTLVTATPADGYAVQKVQDSPDNMAVYFNETAHSFIIHVTWYNNAPFAQVSEVGQ